jgi:hypothetical protein
MICQRSFYDARMPTGLTFWQHLAERDAHNALEGLRNGAFATVAYGRSNSRELDG